MSLVIENLGRMGYEEALACQLEAVEKRRSGECTHDSLLLLEHDPVFTTGRRDDADSLPKNPGATPVIATGRGGNVTWHGPGQLVGYWIRELRESDRDLHRHLRLIEEGLIQALSILGIEGTRVDSLTGVWVNDKKVASIGVAVRNWVTFHGFALNISVDDAVYDGFAPCGLEGAVMSDLEKVSGGPISWNMVLDAVSETFRTLT